MANIDGSVVLVTGASSGIGAATAQILASRGARVMLGARRVDRLEALVDQIRRAGGTAQAVALDVTRQEQVQAALENTVKAFGRIDVMVNNAGIMPLSRMSVLRVDEWMQTIDVNVKGVLYGIAACLPRMKAQGSGHIVHIASIGAHRSYPGAAVYCASKFAVWAIADALRQEETGGDIRVTTISPGTVDSELADSIADLDAANAMKAFRKHTISPAAIAEAIAFAISQPADVDVSEIIVRPTRSPD